MKKISGMALLVLGGLLHTSCDKCSTLEDAGNPERRIQVKANGQNVWFGLDAPYDPGQAKFIHENEGELAYEVNAAEKVLEVTFPLTTTGEEEIEIVLDSATSLNFRYASLEFEQDCEKVYEISYITVDGEQVCRECGKDDKIISLPLN